jgi:hypothetical protein
LGLPPATEPADDTGPHRDRFESLRSIQGKRTVVYHYFALSRGCQPKIIRDLDEVYEDRSAALLIAGDRLDVSVASPPWDAEPRHFPP